VSLPDLGEHTGSPLQNIVEFKGTYNLCNFRLASVNYAKIKKYILPINFCKINRREMPLFAIYALCAQTHGR
jgi:hypothetical protein